MSVTETYITTQLISLTYSSIKSAVAIVILYLTKLLTTIEPYFFGVSFIRILTILLMCDLLVGIGKHLKNKTYSGKLMFNKFVFKFMTITIATVSAKVMIDIDHALDTDILIVAVKLTVALYLFGNIEKNLCQLTDAKLCFDWLITKMKEIFNLVKTKK